MHVHALKALLFCCIMLTVSSWYRLHYHLAEEATSLQVLLNDWPQASRYGTSAEFEHTCCSRIG